MFLNKIVEFHLIQTTILNQQHAIYIDIYLKQIWNILVIYVNDMMKIEQ
jgi:hypothetical protein